MEGKYEGNVDDDDDDGDAVGGGGGEGSRDGTRVRVLASHQCGPGSILGLGVICGLSLLLVLVLSPKGFSPGSPVFPSPKKTNKSKF